jgi:hypothetical protein
VGELDRRRHEMLDWRFQLRRHGRLLGLTAAGLGVLSWGAFAKRRKGRRRA